MQSTLLRQSESKGAREIQDDCQADFRVHLIFIVWIQSRTFSERPG